LQGIAHLNLNRELLEAWRSGLQMLEQRLFEVETEIEPLSADRDLAHLPRATALLASLQRFGDHLKTGLNTEYGDRW
jgi:hypothetical protein